MSVLRMPSPNSSLPRDSRRRRRVVWQPHHAGFSMIAYRDGRAIAGISGPWSNQYVLIWWQPAQPVRAVEVFESLAEAKAAVARDGVDQARWSEVLDTLCHEPIVLPRPAWITRLVRWPQRLFARPARVAPERRRRGGDDTDLRGLNFRAVR